MSARFSLITLLLLSGLAVPFSAFGAEGGNTVVRFEIQRGTNAPGNFDVELFDDEKPETVRNFLLYVRSGAYSNSILHRCVPRFVIQGGGFSVTNPLSASVFSSYLEVTNYGRLDNEFSTGPILSNNFGTLAMAKVGDDPNSATGQWFFNLANNTNLDVQNGGFTVFGRVLDGSNGSNALSHFNSLSTSGGIVNLRNLLGSAYPAFTDLPVSYTSSTTRVPQNRELYFVRISVLNRTNTPGVSPPTLQIVSPPPNSSFTNQSVTVTGTADDDTGVARVIYRLEGGTAQGALGSTNWQFTVTPQPGLNSLTVESIDWEGNRSPSAALAFLYFAQVPLEIQIQGAGRVVGAAKGQPLQVGTFQTLTAIPASGHIFHSWSGAVTSGLPSVTFFVPTNATNISVTAKFIPEPLPRLAGAYKGLFRAVGTPVGANSGSISLSLDKSGTFSGTILHRGGSYSYRGRFDGKGQAIIQGEVGGIHRSITLELQKTNAAGLITGSIAGTADVRLERVAAALPTGNGLSRGRYTFAITPTTGTSFDQLTPAGHGYGTCTVDSTGRLTFSGRLGDGTAFSGSSPLTRLHRWPVYVNLFGGRGVLLGWLGGGANGPGDLDGTLHWLKGVKASDATYPGGFSNQVAFLGSRFQQPVFGERVMDWVHGLGFINGQFQVGMTNLVKLTAENDLTTVGPNPSEVSWSLDPITGLVRGSFVDPWSGGTRILRGAVLKRTQSIFGQFTDRGMVGSVYLAKAPFLVTQRVENVTLPGMVEALGEGGFLQFATNAVVTFTEPLDLRYDTALDANGHNVVFSGGQSTRLFRVMTNRMFSAKGITFADGVCVGALGINSPAMPGGEGRGAGIMNLGGVVALTNCVLTNFFVQGGLGGKNKKAGVIAPGGRGAGAAIYNRGGRVILNNCQLADNLAEGGAGHADSIPGLLSTQRGAGAGGAVFSEDGECHVENTSFRRNTAAGGPGRSDGGVANRGGEGLGGALAVLGGRLQITSSEFRDNRALGPDASTNNQTVGGAHGGAILIETNAVAILDQATLIGNLALGGNSSYRTDSGAARGGAIFNGGTFQLRKSTVEQNTAGLGGGILSGGSLVVDASTMSSNVATAAGGALFCHGGSLAATNSTFAFNSATNGAGLMLLSNSAVVVNNTVAFNAGGGIDLQNGSLLLRNSILASNVPQNLAGALIDAGYNLSSDASALLPGLGSAVNIDPRFAPFSTNGGPTRTIALMANSPARDVVPTNSIPPVDQRGTPRPQGVQGDIGAFEIAMADSPPAILAQPFGGTVRAGSNFIFTVVATGAQPLSYTWLRDGFPAGGTSSNLVVTNAQVSSDYNVIVANAFGSATSLIATLTVDASPILLVQPSDVVVPPGAPVNFTVTVAGPALSYVWFRDGSVLPGINGPTLSFANAAPGMQGAYRAVVTNFAGAVTSRVATLTFNSSALAILQPPANATVAEGASAMLSVLAGGVGSLGYTWLLSGAPIANATAPELFFPAVGLTNQGNYRVVVTNAYLAITSAPVLLTVLRQPILSIRIDGSNVVISCQGTPDRLHHLLHASSVGATQTWSVVDTSIPSGTGNSVWTRPLVNSQNNFFRVALP